MGFNDCPSTVVSIPQAVGVVATELELNRIKNKLSKVSIPQAVGVVATNRELEDLGTPFEAFQYRRR